MSGNGTVIPTFSAGGVLPDTKTLSTGGNTFNYASNQVGGQSRKSRRPTRRSKKHASRKSRSVQSKRSKKSRHNKRR